MKRRNFIAGLLGIPAVGVAATKAEACHLCEDSQSKKIMYLTRHDLMDRFKNMPMEDVEMCHFKHKRVHSCGKTVFHRAELVYFKQEFGNEASYFLKVLKDRYGYHQGTTKIWHIQTEYPAQFI